MPQRQRLKAEALWEQAGSLFSRRLAALPKENAYVRHLASHGAAHSPAEWRKFSDERFRAQIFNNRLDAVVCGTFMLRVAIILLDSLRLWFGIIRGTADSRVAETPFVPTQLNPEEA
jgi:hypothetical protein